MCAFYNHLFIERSVYKSFSSNSFYLHFSWWFLFYPVLFSRSIFFISVKVSKCLESEFRCSTFFPTIITIMKLVKYRGTGCITYLNDLKNEWSNSIIFTAKSPEISQLATVWIMHQVANNKNRIWGGNQCGMKNVQWEEKREGERKS